MFRKYLETFEDVLAERLHHRAICSVQPTANYDSTDAALIVPGIERVPFIPEIDLKPRVEIHRSRVRRYAYVT